MNRYLPLVVEWHGWALSHYATGRYLGHRNLQSHCARAGSLCEVLAGLGRGPSFYVMPYDGGHRSAPGVITALAGLVHDRQSTADYEYNHDKDN
jgi:hypothetical protein